VFYSHAASSTSALCEIRENRQPCAGANASKRPLPLSLKEVDFLLTGLNMAYLTADKSWEKLSLGIKVKLVR
jgi:hypothetical protein